MFITHICNLHKMHFHLQKLLLTWLSPKGHVAKQLLVVQGLKFSYDKVALMLKVSGQYNMSK